MAELALNILLDAQDKAVAVLTQVEKTLDRIKNKHKEAAESVQGDSIKTEDAVGRPTRAFMRWQNAVEGNAAAIVGQFNPALAGMFLNFDRVDDAGKRLGGRFLAMSLALGGVTAATLIGVEAWKNYEERVFQTAKSQAEINTAIARMDVGGLTSKLTELGTTLRDIEIRSRTFLGGLQTAFAEATTGETSRNVKLFQQALEGLVVSLEKMGKFQVGVPASVQASREELARLQAERAREAVGWELPLAGVEAQFSTGGSARLTQLDKEIANVTALLTRQERAVVTGPLALPALQAQAGVLVDPLARLAAQQDVERKRLAEQLQTSVADIGATPEGRRLFGAQAEAMRQARTEFMGKLVVPSFGPEGLQPAGLPPEEMDKLRQDANEGFWKWIVGYWGSMAEPEALAKIMLEQTGEAGLQGDQAGATAPAPTRFGALGNIRKDLLSQYRQLGIELPGDLADAIAKGRQQAGDDALTAEIRNLMLAPFDRLESDKAFQDRILQITAKWAATPGEQMAAGFTIGLRSLEDEFGTAGQNLARMTHDIGRTMADEMSDSFFAIVTGKFQDLPAIAQRAGEAMLRSLIGAVTNTLFNRALGQLFGVGGGGGLPFELAGAGLAGATLIAGGPTGLALATAGGGLVPLMAGAGGLGGASTASGGGLGLGSIPFPPIGLFTGGSGGSLGNLMATPVSQIFGFSSISPGAEALIASAGGAGEAGGLAAGALGEAGLSLGGALGAAGGALGLGFTIYSGLTGPGGTSGALSGAVSGAMSGAMIGMAFGPWGAAIGAIAGGLLGAGAGGFGKGGRGQQQTQAQYTALYQNFQGRADNAAYTNWKARLDQITSLAELHTFLLDWTHTGLITYSAATGGLVGMPAVATYTSWVVRYWPPNSPSRTVLDSNFDVNGDIQTLFDTDFRASSNPDAPVAAACRDALRAKLAQFGALESALQNITIGFEEVITGPGGMAVTRQTILPGSRLGEAQGQQLSVFADTIVNMDDATALALIERLAAADADHSLGYITVDPDARIPITVQTRFNTPPPTGGSFVPAPVLVPAPAPAPAPSPPPSWNK